MIALMAFASALVFSRLGRFAAGWQLLLMQSLMYWVLTVSIRAEQGDGRVDDSLHVPLTGLGAVGAVAGLAGGLLGLGGGLVMVPLMVRWLDVPIRLAIRFSTLAVTSSASAASLQFFSKAGVSSPSDCCSV